MEGDLRVKQAFQDLCFQGFVEMFIDKQGFDGVTACRVICFGIDDDLACL